MSLNYDASFMEESPEITPGLREAILNKNALCSTGTLPEFQSFTMIERHMKENEYLGALSW